jgi:hypothetical protein
MFFTIITILVIAVCIGIIIFNCLTNWSDFEEYALGSIVVLLCGVIVWVTLFFMGFLIGSCGEHEPVLDKTIKINAMKDNFTIEGYGSGSLLISSVYVDEELRYSYKYYEEGKGWKTETVPADECYINILPEGEEPRLEVYKLILKSKTARFWFTDAHYGEEYVFYVPHDAKITEEFVIDLE